MKGVAGVPGDLYNLWHGTGTMNPNVSEAMYLTNTFPGHYKPDLSNYWSSLCIDKVNNIYVWQNILMMILSNKTIHMFDFNIINNLLKQWSFATLQIEVILSYVTFSSDQLVLYLKGRRLV